jgi:hypothetical protein
MQGFSKSTRSPPEVRSATLPNLESASRAEHQLTLEQLARANRRLALLNRVATRLMSTPEAEVWRTVGRTGPRSHPLVGGLRRRKARHLVAGRRRPSRAAAGAQRFWKTPD